MIHELHLPGSIHMGAGSIEKLTEIADSLGVNHLFIVISPSLLKEPVNMKKRLMELLKKDSMKMTLFSAYQGEPTTEHVKVAVEKCKKYGGDCVVAIGGGSAIDLAKAVSVFAMNDEIPIQEIPLQKKLNRLPLVAVPTTAGTGSESTKVMVIKDVDSGLKLNPGHPQLVPDSAILDPELTLTLPKAFTAYTGLDALAHAIEAYMSTKATVLSDYFALEAIRLINEALPRVYHCGNDIKARQNMLLGGCYAGIAFSNSSTNLAHAAGRALGARFHIPHGLCVALLLPFVIEYGLHAARKRYADIGKVLNEDAIGTDREMAEETFRTVMDLNDQFNIWDAGAKYLNNQESQIFLLAEDSLSGNGILTNHLVPGHKDIEIIFTKLFNKITEYSVRF